MTAKIVSGSSSGAKVPTQDVHVNAVPPGATVLGSSGGTKPTNANSLPFFTPTCPVHIDPAGVAYFYVNNAWIKSDGNVI